MIHMCENFIHRCFYINLSVFSSIIHLEDSWTRQMLDLFWLIFNTVSSRQSLDKISQLLEARVGCACVKERGLRQTEKLARLSPGSSSLHNQHLHSRSIGLSALLEIVKQSLEKIISFSAAIHPRH